jgi:hypothetical protein
MVRPIATLQRLSLIIWVKVFPLKRRSGYGSLVRALAISPNNKLRNWSEFVQYVVWSANIDERLHTSRDRQRALGSTIPLGTGSALA